MINIEYKLKFAYNKKFTVKRRILGLFWVYRVVQYFVEMCMFAKYE